MAHREVIPHHSNGDTAAVHGISNIAMESEEESMPSKICLSYWDVHKFQNDGLEAGKIPKMLWKMLQELGFEKQPEYFGIHVTYEDSEPVWHVQVYIFTSKPLRGILRWKRSMQPLHQDVLLMLGFVILHVKHIWSPVCVITSYWMEWSMLIFLNGQVDLRTSTWNPYKTK
jgi:hypothetical protein